MTVRPDVARVGDYVDPPSFDHRGCGLRGPGGYFCTRSLDHGGQHVGAGSEGKVFEVWPSEVTKALRANFARDLRDATWVHVAAVVRPGVPSTGHLEDVDQALTGVLVETLRALADRPLDPEGLLALADFIENE